MWLLPLPLSVLNSEEEHKNGMLEYWNIGRKTTDALIEDEYTDGRMKCWNGYNPEPNTLDLKILKYKTHLPDRAGRIQYDDRK